jgi:putative zinc finger/helix-turn-helix YgiT family protein
MSNVVTQDEVIRESLRERKCYDCGKTMHGRRENYNYAECGLHNVVLLNILVFHCKCGAIVPEIPSPSVLHAAISMAVLRKKTLLSAEEIRFVRKAAGYSATEFAKVLGHRNTSLSHWETGSKPIGKDADRLVRLVSYTRMMENIAGADYGLPEKVSRLARMTRDMNLTTLLEKIEDRAGNSELLRIDPESLQTYEGPSRELMTVQ